MADFFDEMNDGGNVNAPKKPFFEVNIDNDDELKTWMKEEIVFLRQESEFRFQKIKNNYARYKGIQYRDQVYQPRDLPEKRIRYMPQMVVPLISDVIEEKTARLLETKPSVVIIPMNDEMQDKVDAKVAKKFLGHVDQIQDTDTKFFRFVRSSKIAGESFIFTLWNPDAGKMIAGDEPVSLPDGRMFKNPIYEGEISLENETALNVLYEKAKNWDETDYIFRFCWEYTDALKRDYPDKASEITPTQAADYYDFSKMENVSVRGKTLVTYFWHRKTKYLPKGFEMRMCNNVILKKSPLMYEDGELPVIRLIDIENEDEQHGEAQIDKTRAMASQYNNIQNLIIKQQMLCAHPKWFIDGGSVDEQRLGNDTAIVTLKPGSREPKLMQANPVSPQLFEFKEQLKNEFYEMSKSNSIVRGEPPPGVTAFVALQFVSESENRRVSQDVSKVSVAIKDVYKKALALAAQFYRPEDGRTMMIMGKDNRWVTESYDPRTLKGPYSIQIQSASSLPESKALRTQFILDMGKNFPDLFPREQLLEMMGLAQAEKFLDEGTAAARSAEAENEMIFDGNKAPEPKDYEMMIIHWRIHVQAIQDIGFKTKASPQVQKEMLDHLLATEYLMMKQIYKSSAFAQQVNMQLPQFPLLFTPEPPPDLDPSKQMPPPMESAPPMPSQNIPPGGVVYPEEPPPLQPGDPGYSAVKKQAWLEST